MTDNALTTFFVWSVALTASCFPLRLPVLAGEVLVPAAQVDRRDLSAEPKNDSTQRNTSSQHVLWVVSVTA